MRKALFVGAMAVATLLGIGIAPAMAGTGNVYLSLIHISEPTRPY